MRWTIATEPSVAGGARVGSWHGGDRGVVVFLPGRGDSLELRQPIAEQLADRGLSTVMIEHVGQGASGHLGRHPDAVHIDDFGIHLDSAIRTARRASGAARTRPVFLLAHSMGGLIAAHMLARHPTRYAGAVITAPMWGFAGAPPLWASRALSSTMIALGRGRHFAAGERPWELTTCLDMRTTDPARRAELAEFSRHHRDLLRGGSTWGWVRAAARTMTALESLPLEAVRTRVVTVSAARDRTVSRRATARIARRLPYGRLVRVEGGHDLLNEGPTVQRLLWQEIDRTFQQ